MGAARPLWQVSSQAAYSGMEVMLFLGFMKQEHVL